MFQTWDFASDAAFVLSQPLDDPRGAYDRAAPRYDRMHERFLRRSGHDALQRMRQDLRPLLRPDIRVLDLGCGTGHVSRWMIACEPDIRLTLVDQSVRMLQRTIDMAARHVHASAEALPFEDAAFDLIVSAWMLESVASVDAVIEECLRVLAPTGTILLCFCSTPDSALGRARWAPFSYVLRRGFSGRTVRVEGTQVVRRARVQKAVFHGGRATILCLTHRTPSHWSGWSRKVTSIDGASASVLTM